MSPTRSLLIALCLTSGLAARPAGADDLESLRAENARLRARVEQLERENAGLRGGAGTAEATPAPVLKREGPDGTVRWTSEPVELDAVGRAAHYLWIERLPDHRDAVLWIRTEFSGGIYRHTDHLTLTVNGVEYTLPVASYDATRITARAGRNPRSRDHEIVSVTVPPPLLTALAGASTIAGQLGRTPFTVPRDGVASIRAVAK